MPWMDVDQECHHGFAGDEGMVAMVAEIHEALVNPVRQQVRAVPPGERHGVLLADTEGVYVSTPGDVGVFLDGWAKAVRTLVATRPGPDVAMCPGRVAILPGSHLSPSGPA